MINFNKIKKVASILLVFFIVLSTNLVDKDNYNKLRESVTNIYEDRIIASDLLFETVMLIHQKEVAIISLDSTFFKIKNRTNNLEISNYITRYDQTKLTEKEHTLFNDLKKDIKQLKEIEEKYILSKSITHKNQLLQNIKKITLKLQNLSKIQLDESKTQMFTSNNAMKTINIFTHLEIIFLVVMAILVQIIIFYEPKQKD
ncbi:hypothetical protein FHR24_002092 [Wenyingzhuangia heitensis]|uniref:Four helix bundle sensory module for signal transduction n=1 Tax=Wenyingzhuangia heitensis TaxID=1487859 RepID=A0ABX0UB93_9FLAO|nr:chemotaxis protein [Wenyingzhuangia heitensis]NIJ45624.1 hypothetical protein [Wenyingzhuangia heitensis]